MAEVQQDEGNNKIIRRVIFGGTDFILKEKGSSALLKTATTRSCLCESVEREMCRFLVGRSFIG